MKSLVALIIILIFKINFAQDGKNPNVELPDFVITGKDVISVRKVEKMPADLISAISNNYLKPAINPDELTVDEISYPVEKDLSVIDSARYHRGFISIESGRFKLPSGKVNYTFPFDRGMLKGTITGLNQIEYVDNSDRQNIFGSLNLDYSLPIDGGFLPGSRFSVGGEHEKNKYKFFGSVDPDFQRTLNMGSAGIGFQNLYMKNFIFDFNSGGDFTYLDDETFTESIFYLNGFAKYRADDFSINFAGNFNNQSLKTDSLRDVNSNFFLLRSSVSLELFEKIKTDIGLSFSKSGENNFNSIFAVLALEIAENLTLLGEFSPAAEFVTVGELMRKNQYFNQHTLENLFLIKKNKLTAVVKYEFGKYYQIDGGIEYFKAENLPYYLNTNHSGFFEVTIAEAKNLNLFLDLIYHPGPYGIFYASFNYINIENSDGRRIPYYPNFDASISYGYNFNNSLKADLTLNYLSDRYADIENKTRLNGFFDLGFKLTYKIQQNFMLTFSLENIINTKKIIWEGYQEKPLDAAIGLNFFFD
jgi:hypothetical protein